MSFKLLTNIKSLHKLDLVLYIGIFFTFLISIYLLCYGIITSLVSFASGTVAFIALILIIYNYHNKWSLKYDLSKYLLYIAIASFLPCYFLGTARINHVRPKYDEYLINVDNLLFGWLWERGQLSLTLDKSERYNPETSFGVFLSSFLQVFYFLYYITPYGLIYVFALRRCILETIHAVKNNGNTRSTHFQNWHDLYFITSVFVWTLNQNFLLNTFLPAVSPRLYFENTYVHKLKMYGIFAKMQSTFKDNKSANAYPSGHCSKMFCMAFALFRMGHYIIGSVVLVCALFVMMATLVLRYHYISDCIAALVISATAIAISSLFYENKKEVSEVDVSDLLKENGKLEMDLPGVDTGSYMTE